MQCILNFYIKSNFNKELIIMCSCLAACMMELIPATYFFSLDTTYPGSLHSVHYIHLIPAFCTLYTPYPCSINISYCTCITYRILNPALCFQLLAIHHRELPLFSPLGTLGAPNLIIWESWTPLPPEKKIHGPSFNGSSNTTTKLITSGSGFIG